MYVSATPRNCSVVGGLLLACIFMSFSTFVYVCVGAKTKHMHNFHTKRKIYSKHADMHESVLRSYEVSFLFP